MQKLDGEETAIDVEKKICISKLKSQKMSVGSRESCGDLSIKNGNYEEGLGNLKLPGNQIFFGAENPVSFLRGSPGQFSGVENRSHRSNMASPVPVGSFRSNMASPVPVGSFRSIRENI